MTTPGTPPPDDQRPPLPPTPPELSQPGPEVNAQPPAAPPPLPSQPPPLPPPPPPPVPPPIPPAVQVPHGVPPVYGQTLAASAQQTPPGMVQATAIIFLVAGIISVFWAVMWAAGSACCWLPWIAEFVAGIAAITTGAQMLAAPPGPPKKWVSILLIVCVLNCSLFALTAGILTLIFANDARVRDYYLARGITY